MLSRFVEVNNKGELEIKGDPRAMYAGMMAVRFTIVGYSWNTLA